MVDPARDMNCRSPTEKLQCERVEKSKKDNRMTAAVKRHFEKFAPEKLQA
jgi:hypothetical protein